MQKWFVSLDTDKVKEYVFATGRLKEIRGASSLLDHLNRSEIRLHAADIGEVIFAGGGSALVKFDTEAAADNFLAEIPPIYLQQTGSASITAVKGSFDDSVTDRNNPLSFHAALQHTAARLQSAKLAAGRIPAVLLAQPLWARCSRCGVYPSTDVVADPGEGTIRVCKVCKTKRSTGNAQADPDEGPVAISSPTARFRSHAKSLPQYLRFPTELGELGSYIGLIYADGNGIGAFIRETINSPEEMKAFSEILERSILDALIQATASYWKLKSSEGILPFLPVIIGGDDVLLITAGNIALPLAANLCTSFQELVYKNSLQAIQQYPELFGGKPIQAGMSAGVAIAQSSYPLFALEPLAAELLHSAKQLTNELKGPYGIQPVIDFRVISSASASPLNVVRSQEYRISANVWATCRPYPCRRVEGLGRPAWEDVEYAVNYLHKNKFPRNKLHAWQDLLRADSDLQAEIELSVIRAHLSKDQAALIEDITKRLSFAHSTDLFIDNIPENGSKASPLPDIEEIFDFCLIGEAI